MKQNSSIAGYDNGLVKFLFKQLFFRSIRPTGKNPKLINYRNYTIFLLFFLLMAVAFTEPYKVILRRRIGYKSLSYKRLLLAILIYFLWGSFLLLTSAPINPKDLEIYSEAGIVALISGGIFYYLLCLFLLIQGTKEYFKARKEFKADKHLENWQSHIYRGQSIFFKSTLAKVSEEKVWYVREPLICLCISLIIAFLAPAITYVFILIAIPLVYSSISFWFNEWFQVKYNWNNQFKEYQKEKIKSVQEEQFKPSTNDDDEFFVVS